MVSTAVEYLVTFRPRIDAPPSIERLSALVQFAEREKLTVYDAIYVQLALSNNSSLATIDSDLRDCARRLHITLIPT